MGDGSVIIVGGTSASACGLPRPTRREAATVVLTGRDQQRAEAAAQAIGGPGSVRAAALELAEPGDIAAALADLGPVDRLVLGAIDRDENSVADYDIVRAMRLVTLKLIGYTAVVHALMDRLTPESSILLFGGLALQRPYPGSTTVTTVNGGVTGIVHTLAVELAPIRVNGIHPGIVGDSPYWADKPAAVLDPVGRAPRSAGS